MCIYLAVLLGYGPNQAQESEETKTPSQPATQMPVRGAGRRSEAMTHLFFLPSSPHWGIAFVGLLIISPAARADLYFQAPAADAGEVRAGAPLTHKFTFVNRGVEPAYITVIQSSCGCLTPRLAGGADLSLPHAFQPGEQGSILLEVNTLSPAPGLHTWQVKLSYRTGATVAEIPLRLTARLVREIVVEPAAVTMFVEGPVQSEIRITDLRPQPLQIQELHTTSPGLQAHPAGEERDGSGHLVRKVQLEVAGDFAEGRHEEVLSMYTNDPGYREIKVPVTIVKHSRQRVSATPSRIELTVRPGAGSPSRMVLIRDQENQDVEVEGVTCDHPAITCRWAKGPGAMTTVKIQVNGDRLSESTWQGAVRVQLIKPTRQTLEIPVMITGP